ncbi:MAG TPA: multidrug efflux SMR transporter [Sporichthyaceae bacterium]|nr:multidrug efflux SMR transporter [Sporichthyaceae bacterium]
MSWVWLAGAILSEITATLCLRASDGFAKLGFDVVVVIGYVVSFTFLSRSLQAGMSLGVAYGVWSGIGVAMVAMLGRWLFDDRLSPTTVAGIVLIILGVVVVQLGGTERGSDHRQSGSIGASKPS